MIELVSAVDLLPTLELIARGGGGGSGGGGDGGAGGIALLGYLPCHFTSSLCAKHISTPAAYIAGSILGLAILIGSFAIFWPLFPFEAIAIPVGAAIGVVTGSQNVFGKIRAAVQKTKAKVTAAASADSAWQESALQQTITNTFTRYQKDWSDFNLNNIREYTTPKYFQHVSLMLAALHAMGRQNAVDDVRVESQFIADIQDNADNTKDRFTAVITARANDKLVDTKQQKVLYTDNSRFTEYWHFIRDDHTWRLDGIEQATADPEQLHGAIYRFAAQSNMFFSLDWGWLLLPQRGILFNQARFKTSDINNHVIGQWNGILVQLYTYRLAAYNNNYPTYQIAQITLPKSYGGIIIRRKKLFNIPPRGYQKITFEWPDFNDRYVVFATDMDKVTSFELLNPKFMADLYDKQLKVDIEVVDNVVYLYSKLSANETKYPEMMAILQQAFRELKL